MIKPSKFAMDLVTTIRNTPNKTFSNRARWIDTAIAERDELLAMFLASCTKPDDVTIYRARIAEFREQEADDGQA